MSQRRALTEIERFLSSAEPEVLSINGRWGVGKTYAWDGALKAMQAITPLRRYAYVSVFGLRSLDALKTAIVQSTVSLDGNTLEPTVKSFIEHVSSFDGIRKVGAQTARMGEHVARKSLQVVTKGAAAVPYVGKMADLLAPGAALLIRKQIICIDDIERAGQGLDVADILGLVSYLRERRECKVVLLLNEDGLADQTTTYQSYIEKVVDQAVKFEPTAEEAAAAALTGNDAFSAHLARCTIKLGITNIRVIRRIRRFLSFIEPQFTGLHAGVIDVVVHSLALLSWCVFEPALAPKIARVRGFNLYDGLFSSEDSRTSDELRDDQVIRGYGFVEFNEIDEILLAGLNSGAFELDALQAALQKIAANLEHSDARTAVNKTWSIYRDSFADDQSQFLDALVAAIEQHGNVMDPSEASNALEFLRELGRPLEADRLAPIYVDAQNDKPREFFAASHAGFGRPIDPAIVTGFQAKLAAMPMIRAPAEILLEIGRTNGWQPRDIAYLATVPVDEYVAMIKSLRESDLNSAISVAMQFAQHQPANSNDIEVSRKMARALRLVGAESQINAMRVKPYLVGIAATLEDDSGNQVAPSDSSGEDHQMPDTPTT